MPLKFKTGVDIMALGPVYGIGVNNNGGSYTKITVEPVQTNSLTYNGQLQSAVWQYDSAQMKIVEDSGQKKDADTYVVKFKPLSSYCWSDGSQKARSFSWTISPAQIEAPVLTVSTRTFNGLQQSPDISYDSQITTYGDSPSDIFTVQGGVETNASDSYTISWTLKNPNYVWKTAAPAVKTAQWKINKKEITVPIVSETTKTYNTKEQGPTITPATSTWWTAADYVATDVNHYLLTISLVDPANTIWAASNNSDDKTYEWTINPLLISKPVGSPLNFTYNNKAQGPTITNDPSLVYVTRTGNLTEVNSGSYTLKYSLLKNTNGIINTKWSDGSTNDVTISYSIAQLQIPIPTASSTSKEYNGNVQNPGLTSMSDYLDILTITGDTAAEDAGNYNVSYSINSDHNKTVKNVVWEDGTTVNRNIQWSITVKKLTKPSLTSSSIVFSPAGISILDYEKNFNSTFMERLSNSTSQTTGYDVGSYNTVYHLTKNKPGITNVAWANGTADDITLSWQITVLNLTKPAQSETLTYNTKSQKASFNSAYDADLMTVSGDTGTDAKTYTAIFTSKYPGNAQFGTSNTASVSWKINILLLNIPLLQGSPYTYDGNTKTPTLINFDSTYMSSSGNLSAVTANTSYKITVKLIHNSTSVTNTKWADNSTSDKVLTWKIDKAAAPAIKLSSYNVTVTPTNSVITVTVTTASDGTVVVDNLGSDVIACTVTGKKLTISSVNSKDTPSPVTLVINTAESTNYLATTSSTEAKILVSAVGFAEDLLIASTDIVQSNTLYYEGGKSLTAEFSNFDSTVMNISGNTGKDVGEYTATIVCKSGYQFKDKKSSVSVSWTIKEASINVTDVVGNATFKTTYCNETNIHVNAEYLTYDGGTYVVRTQFEKNAFLCDGNENHQLIIPKMNKIITPTNDWTVELWAEREHAGSMQPYERSSGNMYYIPIFNFCGVWCLTMTQYILITNENKVGMSFGYVDTAVETEDGMLACIDNDSGTYYTSVTRSWEHYALVYNSYNKKITFFKKGTGVCAVSYSSFSFPNNNFIFNYEGAYALINEVRVSQKARYSSSFTPPTQAFTKDSTTKMLLHFDR